MRVTKEHWEVFLQLAEENPGLIFNKFNGAQGKAEGHAAWQTAANKLNALGYGQKTVAEWRKAVIDWKSKVKAKASKIKSSANQTGGGTALINNLMPLEDRLLSLMGRKCLEGDSGIPELGLPGTSNQHVSVAPAPSVAVADDLQPEVEPDNLATFNDEQDVLADHQYMAQTLTATLKRKADHMQCSSSRKMRRVNSIRKRNN